ncbi:thioredoxin trx1 [Maublancomyces gigas]|uniref:Thioredoxin trx1 n=1 Tax=Discina gigas TaxID=1032678 RepID=A0ABR3GF65_9PEZI
MVQEIESHEQFNVIIDVEKLVVIDCYAEWCDYPDVDFFKVDVDKLSSVASELGVRAMPTFYFFKKGEKVGEVVGANPPALKAAIEKYS